MLNNYKGWIEASLDPAYNDEDVIEITERIIRNKIPLVEIYTGDLIVVGNNPSEVIFLSHEGDKLHGKILGDNLWDFLEFHTKVGFVGFEDWHFEPFYDFQNDKLKSDGKEVEEFNDWLNK